MIGLIKKDIIICFKSIKPLYFIVPLCTIIPLSQLSINIINYIICTIITFIFVLFLSTSFQYDEQFNWNTYAAILPLTQSVVVLSKYLFLIFLLATSGIINIFVIGVINTIFHNPFFHGFFSAEITAITSGMFYGSIIIPATYKFGITGSRYILILFFLIPSLLPYFFKLFDANLNIDYYEILKILTVFLPGGIIIIMFCSFIISLVIYRKLEFK